MKECQMTIIKGQINNYLNITNNSYVLNLTS